ncbi:hypothetical protein Tco_0309915 [Tanacetum coccineum]
MSRNYTLDEDTYPTFLHDDGTETGNWWQHGVTVVRVVVRINGNFMLVVVKETEIEIVRIVAEEDVAAEKPKSPRKKRQAITDVGGSSHPLKKLRSNYRTSSGGTNLPFVTLLSDVVPPVMTKAVVTTHVASIPEDLETLWKLVKAKHGNTRPEEAYERVLWGDLKVMFEHDVESEVWRNLQGYNVTVWKLFSSNRVHFVRFQNLHIFMLVKQKYPLTPATITKMLNKKLQTEHWNEICYQLLKLMTKQCKNPGSV